MLHQTKPIKNEISNHALPEHGQNECENRQGAGERQDNLNREKAEARLNIEMPRTDVIKWNLATMRHDDRDMTENDLLNTIDQKFNKFRYHFGTRLLEYSATSIRESPSAFMLSHADEFRDINQQCLKDSSNSSRD